MHRKISITVLGLGLTALAACGSSGQEATVVMTDKSCSLSDSALNSGPVTFKVDNKTGHSAEFIVTENDGEKVDSTTLVPGQQKQVQVDLDEDDVYHLSCAGTPGPDIKPQE
jgi:uncharacterized cupredoxin-like copper-binding protein